MEDITKRVAALSDKELSNLGKAISNELREREKASAAENADLGGFAIEDIPLFCQNSALLNELIETTPDVLSLQIRSDNMVGILCGVYILVLLLWRQWMS